MAISEAIRKDLIMRCSSRRTRSSLFTENAPVRWQPNSVKKPGGVAEYFTEESAWEFIATALCNGADVETIELDHPPGKTGYVMLLGGHASDVIYVKLQLVSSLVIGRSFHLSTSPRKQKE